MKTFKQVEVTKTETVLDECRCDLCGEKIAPVIRSGEDRVQMKHEWAQYSGPDSGEAKYTEFDVCGRCFQGKVVPWMKTLGAEPRIKELDW